MSAAASSAGPNLNNVYYGYVTRIINAQSHASTMAVCVFIPNARERGLRASQGLVLQRSPEELGFPPSTQLPERMEVLVKYNQDPSTLRQRIFRRERPAGTCIAVSKLNRLLPTAADIHFKTQNPGQALQVTPACTRELSVAQQGSLGQLLAALRAEYVNHSSNGEAELVTPPAQINPAARTPSAGGGPRTHSRSPSPLRRRSTEFSSIPSLNSCGRSTLSGSRGGRSGSSGSQGAPPSYSST